jgi:hypothetical protein
MVRIAFDLDRATVHRRDDERHRTVTPRHRGRIVERLARNDPLGALGERHQMHLGLAATVQAEASQRHRGAHQFQETPARNFVAFNLRCASGKFAFQPVAKLRRVAQFAKTAPVLLAGLSGRGMLQDAFHRNALSRKFPAKFRKLGLWPDFAGRLPACPLTIRPDASNASLPNEFIAIIGGTPDNLSAPGCSTAVLM